MLNCQKQLEYLGEIVDGTAPFSRKLSFYLHIGICWRCRGYFKQFKQVKKAAETVTHDDLPEDFFAVMDKAIGQIDHSS